MHQNDGLLSIVLYCALGIESATANTWGYTHWHARTHACLSSICVSIFRRYKAEAHTPHHFFCLIIGIFYRFELPAAEGIQTTTIQLGEPDGSPKK